MFGGIIVIN